MKNTNLNIDPEDQKYGGLEVDNWEEAKDYFNLEEFQIINSSLEDFDGKYHNAYRVNGKDNHSRTLRKGETRLITPEEADQWYEEYLEELSLAEDKDIG